MLNPRAKHWRLVSSAVLLSSAFSSASVYVEKASKLRTGMKRTGTRTVKMTRMKRSIMQGSKSGGWHDIFISIVRRVHEKEIIAKVLEAF